MICSYFRIGLQQKARRYIMKISSKHILITSIIALLSFSTIALCMVKRGVPKSEYKFTYGNVGKEYSIIAFRHTPLRFFKQYIAKMNDIPEGDITITYKNNEVKDRERLGNKDEDVLKVHVPFGTQMKWYPKKESIGDLPLN